MLEPSFQREPPGRAPAQLDLDVVEGDELLHRLHSLPAVRFRFSAPLRRVVTELAAPVSVPRLLHHPLRQTTNGWGRLLGGGGGASGRTGEGEKFQFGVKREGIRTMAFATSGQGGFTVRKK